MFYLNKLEIPKVDQCKYLGIMISIKKLWHWYEKTNEEVLCKH